MNIINSTTFDNFTHLHVHTINSLLDGANKIDDCIKRAKELNMKSIAITDHNHIKGWIDFKRECEENGIKPILGCEMYQTHDTSILSLPAKERRDNAIKLAEEDGVVIPTKVGKKKITAKEVDEYIKDYIYDTKQYHLVVLAMNQTGLQNLIKLQSEAADKCTFNGRYCCDFEMLEKYNEGLIILSACLGGLIPNSIIKNKIDKAEEYVLKYKEIFGDRFYLEIQPLNTFEQNRANVEIINFAKKHDIQIVATNDVHYTYKEDFEDHDTLLCIGIGKTKNDENRMKYEHEFWIRSKEEMLKAFYRHENLSIEDINTAINNTNVIADRIEDNLKLGSNTPLFPKVQVPNNMTAEEYLTLKSYKALYKYLSKNQGLDVLKYQIRLCEELDIINSKGYAPYMLKIFENVEFCEENDIPIGPGRGSAAGSLCLFVNGGTKVVDPIKYDLLFFRFLTKDRVDPPDVDMDYSYYGRDKLIKHLEEIHGQNAVCHIGTITSLGVKSGIKDFGRVLSVPYGEVDAICKEIDSITEKDPNWKFKDFDKLEDEIQECIEEKNPVGEQKARIKLQQYKALENRYPEIFRLAKKYEGTPRNFGVHASGVLVMPCDVTDYFPTRTVNGTRIALFTGPELESLGAIKLDILGLKTLDVLDMSLKSINPKYTVNDLYEKITEYLTNEQMYKMVQSKEVEGLFQIESNLFKRLVQDIMPTDENDLCAILAIGRPGPLSAGMHTQYAQRKNGFEVAIPQLRGTDEITANTFHTIIYQEQCMLIAKKVAGFDDSQADSLCRKPLAKKKKALMEIFRRCFIYGKVNRAPENKDDEDNPNKPYYDKKHKYGPEIKGGLANGYTIEELEDFYEKLKGYASYLFNKSHSASYSVITLCTMYLKTFYREKFFAALLSMQENEEKIKLYSTIAKAYKIKIKAPNINISKYMFEESESNILYGLKSIKGIGDASIQELINNAPYKNLEDALERVPKKYLNKKVGVALIKSGAFDFYKENRYELLNEFYDLRKDKEDRYDISAYDKDACINLEKEVLGTNITYENWWDSTPINGTTTKVLQLEKVTERTDKNARLMAYVSFKDKNNLIIPGIIFASNYRNAKNILNVESEDLYYELTFKKSEDNKMLINKVNLSSENDFTDEIRLEDIDFSSYFEA